MVELTKDKKSGMWIVTTTDSEGFHRQLNLTDEDMMSLIGKYAIMKSFKQSLEEEVKRIKEIKIPRGC